MKKSTNCAIRLSDGKRRMYVRLPLNLGYWSYKTTFPIAIGAFVLLAVFPSCKNEHVRQAHHESVTRTDASPHFQISGEPLILPVYNTAIPEESKDSEPVHQ